MTDLIAALDGIPFAIAVAAGAVRAKKQTPAAFLAALPKRPEHHAAAAGADRQLQRAEQPTARAAPADGRDLPGRSLGGIVQPDRQRAGRCRSRRRSRCWRSSTWSNAIQRYGRPYYRLHTITHTFAQTWLRGSGRLEGLQNKVRDAVLAYARKYSGTPDRLAAEMENFLATARWAADQGDRDVAKQLAVALMQAGDFVNARGYVYELLLLRRLAASSTSAFPAYGEAPDDPALRGRRSRSRRIRR